MELEIAIEGRPSTFVIANAVPLRDAHGRPRGAISALVDITERKRVEERLIAADRQLRESQRLMELAQEAGHVGFFHYQFGADRLTWTPGQCKLFGIAELPAGTLRRLVRNASPRPTATASSANSGPRARCAGKRKRWSTACRGRTAASRWLSSRVMLQYDGEGRAAQLIGVTVDMTDQMETERAAGAN